MKKTFAGLFLVLIAIGFTALANTKRTVMPSPSSSSVMHFIYLPSDVPTVDASYENPNNWQYVVSAPNNCGSGSATCYLSIDADKIPPSGSLTEEERLAGYLFAQDGSTDFTNAIQAVNNLRQATKVSIDD